MNQLHQAVPAPLSSAMGERGCVWLKQKQAEILVAWAPGGGEGWDREVAGDIEQGSSPGRLLLGTLGVVLADVSIKGDRSRAGPSQL